MKCRRLTLSRPLNKFGFNVTACSCLSIPKNFKLHSLLFTKYDYYSAVVALLNTNTL